MIQSVCKDEKVGREVQVPQNQTALEFGLSILCAL